MNGATEPNDGPSILTDEYDPTSSESLGVRIPRLIAAASDRELDDLEPLYYSIDSDALESLMGTNSAIEVNFEYEGYTVSILPNQTIEISRPTD